MTPPKKTLMAVVFLLTAAFWPVSSPAEPVASTMPAAPLQQSSGIIPVESQNERSLRAEVVEVRGDVSSQTQGSQEFTKLSTGAVLHAGDVIKTEQGSCRLLIDGKIKVSVTPLATLKISSESLLDLHRGNIMVQLSKLKKGSSFEVTTPTATAVVRGTTLYLETGNGFSKLYVDETHGGVIFKNIFSGKSVLVPAFSLSNSSADGKLDEPAKLTPEQKEAFFKEWQGAAGSNLSQQFGIEEVVLPPAGPPGGLPDLQNIPNLDDAQLDKLTEQNIPGSNGFVAPPPPETTQGPTEEELQAQERAMIHEKLADLMGDQAFDSADAQQARVADAQTGKVFKDVHGNRVRVDQYISQVVVTPEDEEIDPFTVVSLLSLTARAGSDYQKGVTALEFDTAFNRVLTETDGALKDLPWNDYLRVIMREDLNGGDVPTIYEQFIVHEHRGNTENAPDLYPVVFLLGLEGPAPSSPLAVRGSLSFGEIYSDPFHVDSAQGSFWVQGLDADIMTLTQSTGETLVSGHSVFLDTPDYATINGVPVEHHGSDHFQSPGLSTDPVMKILMKNLMTEAGLNAARNADTGIHPAHFEDTFVTGNPLGDSILIGIFLPINDQGEILNPEGGFNLRGIRDVVSPNPRVNGGQYNLELLFIFGHGDETHFTEAFRIDALVTPEIFTDFGSKDPDTGLVDHSSVFPFHFDTTESE